MYVGKTFFFISIIQKQSVNVNKKKYRKRNAVVLKSQDVSVDGGSVLELYVNHLEAGDQVIFIVNLLRL